MRSAPLAATLLGLASFALGAGAGATTERASAGEVTNVFAVPSSGGPAVRLTNNVEPAEETFAYDPSWAPDGNRIAFSQIACDGCRPEIHVIPARPARGKNWLGRPIGYGLYPRWAPNGKAIAFVGTAGAVYVMRADGSHRRLIAKGGLSADGPSWSPDSKRLVFARQETAVRWRLFIVTVAGGRLRPLTSGRVPAVNPAWSPNGRRIAFAQEFGRWQIFTVKVDGRSRTRISDGRASDTFPTWSPDGRQLAFVRQRASATAIFTMRADGRDVRRLSPRLLSALQPAWSPDGRRIAFAG
jgi:Tol biopolymer transport system component